jgi:N-acetylmuramoyl-L-alanine amidase
LAYEIIQNLITRNYESRTFTPIGMVVHETAVPGAPAINIRNAFQRSAREASAHYAVDWNTIIHIVPDTNIAWHACYTANHRFIGVELCRPKVHDENAFNEVWNHGVWLFAYIFKNVIGNEIITSDNLMSHHEVSLRWHETTHTDPTGYFAEYGRTVDYFRRDVQNAINNVNGGRPKLRRLIAYGNSIDQRAAQYLADFYSCPVIALENLTQEVINATEKIIVVGGGIRPTQNSVLVSGSTRFDTMANVLQIIQSGTQL